MRAALLTLSTLLIGAVAAHAQDAMPASQELAAPSASDAIAPQSPAAAEETPEPALSPTAAAAEAEPVALTEAELSQLGFDAADPSVDYSVRLSGFMDFGMNVAIGKFRSFSSRPAFAIGNLNVYLSKNITDSVRTMAEVRLLYLPNGSPKSLMDRSTTSTAASDYADFNRDLHWGGVEIERVYIEWAIHSNLTIRAGQFLTPYGVWNVDHGSPTIITVQRPFVIGYNFFPERQTGIELYGRVDASANGAIGYHLTLSNGTGPASEYQDLDKNKAIGARLYWEYRKWGELRLGGSAYYGRDTDSTASSSLVNGQLINVNKITRQSDSLALALDATFKYEGIHVQAEFVSQQLAFTPEGRTASFSLATLQSNYPANNFRYGGYLLIGYRLPWLGLMPYVAIQRVGGVDALQQTKDGGYPALLGLNIRPIDSLVGKIEYAHVFFDKGQVFPPFDIQVLSFQLAWAF